MRHRWSFGRLAAACSLSFALAALVHFEHCRSAIAELWIVSLPSWLRSACRASRTPVRGRRSGSTAFDDRGRNVLRFYREGRSPVPAYDRGRAVA